MNIVAAYNRIKYNFKTIIIFWLIGLVIGIIITLSIPKEYDSKTILAPENSSTTASYGLNKLLNFDEDKVLENFSSIVTSTKDAIYPMIYPLFFESDIYQRNFLDIKVDYNGSTKTLKEYLMEDLSYPWWHNIISSISLNNKHNDESNQIKIKYLNKDNYINEEDLNLIRVLKDRITLTVDRKNFTMEISSTFQDPLISAQVTESVTDILSNTIKEYRKTKFIKNYEFVKNIHDYNQVQYDSILSIYSNFKDTHKGLLLGKFRTEEEKLKVEVKLKKTLLNQISTQLMESKAKISEERPVFVVLSPAIVPAKSSYPKPAIFMIGFILVSTILSLIYIFQIKK